MAVEVNVTSRVKLFLVGRETGSLSISFLVSHNERFVLFSELNLYIMSHIL